MSVTFYHNTSIRFYLLLKKALIFVIMKQRLFEKITFVKLPVFSSIIPWNTLSCFGS